MLVHVQVFGTKGTNGFICLTMTWISVSCWTLDHPGRGSVKCECGSPPGPLVCYSTMSVQPQVLQERRTQPPPPRRPWFVSLEALTASDGSSSSPLWGRGAAASSAPADSGTAREDKEILIKKISIWEKWTTLEGFSIKHTSVCGGDSRFHVNHKLTTLGRIQRTEPRTIMVIHDRWKVWGHSEIKALLFF